MDRKSYLESEYNRTFEQILHAASSPHVQSHWRRTGNHMQLIYRIGHTFTTVPNFGDEVHDILKAKFHAFLRERGIEVKDPKNTYIMIDRVEGDCTMNVPAEIYDEFSAKLAEYRAEMLRKRSAMHERR